MSEYIRASDGNGVAVTATVTSDRGIGSLTLIVDSVLNWPHKGIATVGTAVYDSDNNLTTITDPTVFKFHLDGSIIEIDGFAPGYTDNGNTIDQIVILKPTTDWADDIAESLDAKVDISAIDTDGTLSADSDTKIPSQKAVKTYVDTGLSTKLDTSGGTITGDLAVQGDTDLNNLIVSGTADLSGAEVLLPDTGWTSLPLASGFNGTGVGGSYPPQYRKINNVVYMRGIVAKNSGNITTSTPPFATLPASIRPLTKNVYFDRPCGATGNMARLEFDSNGVCYIVYVSGSGTYLMLDGINYPL